MKFIVEKLLNHLVGSEISDFLILQVNLFKLGVWYCLENGLQVLFDPAQMVEVSVN